MYRFIAIAILSASLCSCASVGPQGLIFAAVDGPGDLKTGATEGRTTAYIRGESCAFSILSLVAIGDWSIDAALLDATSQAKAEGKSLKNVTVDHRVLNIIGLFTRYCTTVSAQVVD
jgi:hypothetical protein